MHHSYSAKISKLEDQIREQKDFSDAATWSNKVLKNRLAAVEKDHLDLINKNDEALNKQIKDFDETIKKLETINEDYHTKVGHLYDEIERLRDQLASRDREIDYLKETINRLENDIVTERNLSQEKEIALIKKFKRNEISYYKSELDSHNSNEILKSPMSSIKTTPDESKQYDFEVKYDTIESCKSLKSYYSIKSPNRSANKTVV
jgi:peptidoglycan hydrolase CwlO-like protein